MQLIISPDGSIRCLYDETLDLTAIGATKIRRASHVEPDEHGGWTADLGPVGGPTLGPYSIRSEALAAEQVWLERHWLMPSDAV